MQCLSFQHTCCVKLKPVSQTVGQRQRRWARIIPALGKASRSPFYECTCHSLRCTGARSGNRLRRGPSIEPALGRCIMCIQCILFTRHLCMMHRPVLNRCWPAPTTLAQHSTDIGSVSACTVWPHSRQNKALPGVDWMLASAGDGGPALNRNWVTYSRHIHQLKIVMSIK